MWKKDNRAVHYILKGDKQMKLIYKYHRMTAKVSGFGITEYRFEKLHEIIDGYASEGWRYAGWIPVLQRGNGYIEEIDLVLVK